MWFSVKCVFFVCVGIHKSEEHNSESTNNYSGKTQRAPEAPLRKQVNFGFVGLQR